MAFCINCGKEVVEGDKFCANCGKAIDFNTEHLRKTVYDGEVHKCPNCGEVLKAFMRNCPTCGFELREVKPTSAVREFALKLEAIEARREYEKPKGLFLNTRNQINISKTDEQKINLIQNFSVPNTKEDMLEFMILATSNINVKAYDSTNTSITKGEKAITDAWNSKIKQIYEKAKRSYGEKQDFAAIQELYTQSFHKIKKAKKTGIVKWGVMFGWIPILLVIIFLVAGIKAPGAEKREVARLETIYKEAQIALKNNEYKKALLSAEEIVYSPNITNRNTDDLKRQWNIKRELLVDEILHEAEKNGVQLEYSTLQDDKTSDSSNPSAKGGVIQGIEDSAQPGIDAAKDNIDEFNKIMNDETKKEQ